MSPLRNGASLRWLAGLAVVGALGGCPDSNDTGEPPEELVPEALIAPDADLACQDPDGDGFGWDCRAGRDCDEEDAGVHPGAAEVCGDGVDQDCDGVDLACPCPDVDGDTYTDEVCGGADCNDDDDTIHPGAAEVCGDSIDQDCDGVDPACPCPDADGDGYTDEACGGTDCNDTHPAIHPGAVEVCDAVDNDCEGGIDEDFAPDCLPCTEIEHAACTPGEVRPCGTHTGECVAGIETCDATGEWSGVCAGGVGPTGEVQNGLDDNCDGTADEDLWPITTPCADNGVAWRVAEGADPGGDGQSWGTAFSTLEAALAAAGSCDEVWVAGTLTLTDNVVIDAPIRIYGGFAGDEANRSGRDPAAHVTTFDGGGTVHCFSISAGTLFDGVTVTDCSGDTSREGGAIDVRGAPLHLRDTVFADNVVFPEVWSDRTWGGAIYATDGADVSIEGSRFEGNVSKWHGGAIAVVDADLLVHDTWFVDNHSDDWAGGINIYARGGAVFAEGAGTAVFVGATFEGNWCWAEGNAIYAYGPDVYILDSTFWDHGLVGNIAVEVEGDEATAVLHGSLFEGNGTSDGGGPYGVVNAYHGVYLTVSECDFVNNDNLALSARGSGDTMLEVSDSLFTGNVRSLSTTGVAAMVSHTRFERDRHRFWTVDVSAIQDPYGVVTFTDCTFADNEGTAMLLSWVDVFIDSSVLVRNAGHFLGGALELDEYADLVITNSVIADNWCEEDGAAAFVDDHSTLTLDHVTVVANEMADQYGAALRVEYHSELTVTNSVLWGNWPRPAQRDNSSTLNAPEYSVVPDGYYWDDPSYHNLVGDPAMVDPAAGDYRLAAWSPALDIALPGTLTVDIDGHARDLDGDGDGTGAPDPGAFEHVADLDNLPPIALALDGLQVAANGIPLSEVTLQAGKTCDPDDDPLSYTWYGPRGELSGAHPQALLSPGTSLLTLVAEDGALPSDPHTIQVHIAPCQTLTASRAGDDVTLSWTVPDTAEVYRAPGTDPARFGLIAQNAASAHTDTPPEQLDVALYAVVADGCASNVVAVPVADTPPANSDPVIWSTPSDYGAFPHPVPETVTLAVARFGTPYAYHVQAADPDRDPLAYALADGPAGADLDQTGLFTWVPDQTGTHPVSIEVSDGRGGTATQDFSLVVDNRAPIADAGRDVTLAQTGLPVTLDGSGSSDPDGDTLGFAWAIVSAPLDSVATLSNPSVAQPQLTPDRPGRYTVALAVDDGSLSSARDFVVVQTLNLRPIAVTTWPNVPGEYDSTHWRGETVALDGSGSWDPEGSPLTYYWTMLRRPVGSQAELSDPTHPRPTFVVDVYGEYDLTLVVSDGEHTSFPEYSYIAARNRDPEAIPGPDRVAAIGETVAFDCSLSYDPDGDPFVCRWGLYPPDESDAVLLGGQPGEWLESWEASFVPDVVGTYYVSHQAEDPYGGLGWTDALVTVAAGTNPPVITTTPTLAATVGEEWSYDADADDADDPDTQDWSLPVAPEGMEVVSDTGVVTWTPTLFQIGDHDVVLRVTDEAGIYDEQVFTLTASLSPQPPRIGCPSSLAVVAGDTLAVQLEAYDPNGDALTFAKGSGPAAVTLDDGELVWETGAGDAGSYVVTATVSDGVLEDTCTIAIEVIDVADDDGDYDGFAENDGDCDDDDPTVYPGAPDVAGDGLDQDCAGGDPDRSVGAGGPTEEIELLVGESVWVPHVVYVDRTDGGLDDLTVDQEVIPDTGLLLESDLSTDPVVDSSQTRLATALVTAEVPGDYLVVTTVTDTATGDEAVAQTPIRVLDGSTPARLLAPGFFPGGVPADEPAIVDVAVRMVHGDPPPAYVWLDRTDAAGTPVDGIGWLLDTGEGADLAAGDGVFSGTILVSATAEGTLYYRAETDVPVGTEPVVSEVGALAVTRFPIGPPDTDLDDVVYDPDSGSPVLAGQVSVRFAPGTSPDDAEAAAADLGATITGFLPELEVYVLSLPPLTSGDDLAARLATLEAHPDVDEAAASGVARAEMVPVTDPVQGDVAWADTVHSTESWVFGFEASPPAIAVVDTGIDGLHPELRFNHRVGWNMFCGLCDVDDDNAHGTEVAGVIAADTNTRGIAGILPDARVLVVKALDAEGRASTEHLAWGLIAASKRGADVINASFGQFRAETDPMLMILADYEVAADGALLVAAAGNENTSRPLFPAACEHALSVGGVGLNAEERWKAARRIASNYGNWIDIAAPAEHVLTTTPTDNTTDWDADEDCTDFADPGYPLLATLAQRRAKGCYSTPSGTSFATPMVVGAAGKVLERFPRYTARQVRARLEQTAVPRTSPLARGLGHGLLDAFQAVFNGGFEAEEVHDRALARAGQDVIDAPCVEWVPHETWGGELWPLDRPCYHTGPADGRQPDGLLPDDYGWHLLRYGGIPYQPFRHVHSMPGGVRVRRLGPIEPPEGEHMAMLSTGRGDETNGSIYILGDDYWTAQYLDILEQSFTIAPGQDTLTVSFRYDFVTEEAPFIADRLDWPDPDYFTAVLDFGDHREVLALRHMWEMEFGAELSPVEDLTLSEGYPVRHTGWQYVYEVVNIDTSETGPLTLRFTVGDGAGRDLDSVLLIDDVRIE